MFAEGPAMEEALILLSAATPPRTRRMALSSSARYLPLLALLLLLTPPVVDEHFGSLAFFSLPRRATRHFGRQKHLLEFLENNRQKKKGINTYPTVRRGVSILFSLSFEEYRLGIGRGGGLALREFGGLRCFAFTFSSSPYGGGRRSPSFLDT